MTSGKRLVDLTASIVGSLLLLPLGIVIAMAVAVDGGPVFYRQVRIGRFGREFRIWKFRTMVTGADKRGPLITAEGDSRITRVGTWLRRTKLDELPQLLNVIAGEMSLVGPRPEVARYVSKYSARQRAVLDLVPGITDPASLHYANESELLAAAEDAERFYVDVLMPDKINRNLAYFEQATVMSDLLIVLRTLGLVARRTKS